MVQNDDEVWRSIVDNYGERPELDEQPGAAPDAAASAPDGTPEATPEATSDEQAQPRRGPAQQPAWDDDVAEPEWQEERFVPPPPPPLPTTTTDRTAAWLGIFGSPLILLVTLVLGIRLPEIINYALVLSFVGGFLYLVLKMNREPRDPDDNGAVL